MYVCLLLEVQLCRLIRETKREIEKEKEREREREREKERKRERKRKRERERERESGQDYVPESCSVCMYSTFGGKNNTSFWETMVYCKLAIILLNPQLANTDSLQQNCLIGSEIDIYRITNLSHAQYKQSDWA